MDQGVAFAEFESVAEIQHSHEGQLAVYRKEKNLLGFNYHSHTKLRGFQVWTIVA